MLSILIPTYNRAHLIQETVAHALAALEAGDELIIRDNASTDGSPALLMQLAEGDARIRLELAETNAGPVVNWRECLRLARGSHVKLLFSDDLVFPEEFRAFRAGMVEGEHRVGFTAAQVGPDKENAKPEYVLVGMDGSLPAAFFIHMTLTKLGTVPVSPCAFVFETDLFTHCFDKALVMLQDKPEALSTGAGIDLLIVSLAVQHADSSFYSSRPHVLFRRHAQSLSTEQWPLIKKLYNIARLRLASGSHGHVKLAVLAIGYAWADATSGLRQFLRDRRA